MITFSQSVPTKPTWASGLGQDSFGYFAEFSVLTGEKYWDRVVQRMRWIPPGSFMMGSSEDETERDDDEGQHNVVLTEPYWLADTACTQQLWQAIMDGNPSGFVDQTNPVENVSFDEVLIFIETLNERLEAKSFALPTEAQWEYACRARATTPFSFGETVSTDQANYDGQHPYGSSEKGEYRQKTVLVQSLPANSWGLYEMHGNVWEWCKDWYGEYGIETQQDPSGAETGSARVVRGGSWFNVARHVRSAYRIRRRPGSRDRDLGFRLLSSVK